MKSSCPHWPISADSVRKALFLNFPNSSRSTSNTRGTSRKAPHPLQLTSKARRGASKSISTSISSSLPPTMPLALSRATLRQSQFLLRRTNLRNASSTTEAASNAASKAQQTGSKAVSQASEGLSRVTSSAGPAISGAASRVGNALKGIGGRTGRIIGFVECKCMDAWSMSYLSLDH